MLALDVPLRASQVRAAVRLYRRLDGWTTTDRALRRLAERFTKFDAASTLLKTVTINSLYGTNVFAVVHMAEHTQRVLATKGARRMGPELVERIARLPRKNRAEKARRFHSFAAKFAHFFVDPDRFPIFDSYAKKMVEWHLGRAGRTSDSERRYVAFVENLDRLRDRSGIRASNWELDRYLWIAGQLKKWRENHRATINTELTKYLESASRRTIDQLDEILPAASRG